MTRGGLHTYTGSDKYGAHKADMGTARFLKFMLTWCDFQARILACIVYMVNIKGCTHRAIIPFDGAVDRHQKY